MENHNPADRYWKTTPSGAGRLHSPAKSKGKARFKRTSRLAMWGNIRDDEIVEPAGGF
jgi:hypothetical protein